eukprot:g16813.t1
MQVDGRKFEISSGIARLQSAGLKHVLLMFENCAGDAQTAAPLPEIGEGASDLSVVVLASAGAAQACPPAGERLSDTLKQVGKAEALMVPELAAYVQQGELDDLPDQPLPQTNVVESTPARRDQVLITDVVRVIPASAPAGLTPVSVPAASAQRRPERSDASAPVVIFSPVSNQQLAALPQADGLPEPSIIVGLIEGADQNFDAALDPSDLSGNEISYDNVEARRSLMRQDPDLYAGLLASGAFDPPGPLLVRALQQELARMGCYTSRVDGAWGPGSQRAVVRYYDEAGVQVPTQAAEVSLYRDIIGREDENESYLRARGHQVTAGRLYLAHFLGAAGANQALSSDPNLSVEEVMGAGVVSANPFLRGKNIADLLAWADRKMQSRGQRVAVVIPPQVKAYMTRIDALLADL